MEEIKLPSIIPISKSITVERKREAIPRIRKPKTKAPNAADKVTLSSRISPERLPVAIKESATNKCEPEVRPKTDGPASGLFNKVCKSKPETDNAAPAISAITTSGTRKMVKICHESFVPFVKENHGSFPFG